MARISVQEILIDPDLTDRVIVIRRKEAIDNHGRASTQNTEYPGIIAVVTMASPTDLNRKEDYQYQGQTISVITNFVLYHEVKGYQPDIIVWRDNQYLVTTSDPYPQFGQGFSETICTSFKAIDDPSLPNYYQKQMVFANPKNSQYIPVLQTW